MKCNQSRPGLELVSPCPFPTTITTTPQAPPKTGIGSQGRTESYVLQTRHSAKTGSSPLDAF